MRLLKIFADFYWSLQLKNSTVNLKFKWIMAPIYYKSHLLEAELVADHKQITLSAATSRTTTYMVELFARIANGF